MCWFAGACQSTAPPAELPVHDGPIVFITLDALRADVVDAAARDGNLTPHMERLAEECDWAGRAVSPSSWTVPAMASLMTGLQPWVHGNWDGERTTLAASLITVAEALKTVGYRTAGYRANHWLQSKFGYSQGFDVFYDLNQGGRARANLASVSGRDFVWVHILPPHAPYLRHDAFLSRLPDAPPGPLPERLRPDELEPYFDPQIPLPAALRERAWALYRLNVAWADEVLGGLLEALRSSDAWDKTFLVVTADHGEQFGESGQVLHGGNLDRSLIEVPLWIKLPKAYPGRLVVEAPFSTVRLAATMVEAAGGHLGPGFAPNLFDRTPSAVVSELYSGNGINDFSLVDGAFQLLWTARFAASETDYYRARLDLFGIPVEPPLAEPAAALFARLEQRFVSTSPWRGDSSTPVLTLRRWSAEASEEIREDVVQERLARSLRGYWDRQEGSAMTPADRLALSPPTEQLTGEDRAKLRALGYATPGGG